MSLVLHDNQDGDDDNGLMQRNGPDRTVNTIKVLPKSPAVVFQNLWSHIHLQQTMALPVVELQDQEYKIRKIFA